MSQLKNGILIGHTDSMRIGILTRWRLVGSAIDVYCMLLLALALAFSLSLSPSPFPSPSPSPHKRRGSGVQHIPRSLRFHNSKRHHVTEHLVLQTCYFAFERLSHPLPCILFSDIRHLALVKLARPVKQLYLLACL